MTGRVTSCTETGATNRAAIPSRMFAAVFRGFRRGGGASGSAMTGQGLAASVVGVPESTAAGGGG